ncbi:MAG: glycosyl hydrolase [Pseudomonadota bacterium]
MPFAVPPAALVLLTSLACALAPMDARAQAAQRYSSDGTNNWVKEADVEAAGAPPAGASVIRIDRAQTRQVIEGFGGTFNERGWDALDSLPAAEREAVIKNLFAPGAGLNFTIARTPVGASDYAFDAYSYNETPGDYANQSFSIKRDERYLLPYLKAALAIQPKLEIFASPWSPPAWMKANARYDCHSDPGKGHLVFDDRTQTAYADYFVRYVKAYAQTGVPIKAIHVQNEVTACQIFPSSVWTGAQLASFMKHYLVPAFKAAGLDTEQWLSTITHTNYQAYAEPVFSDPELARHVAGVGYQWDGKYAVADTRKRFPKVRIYQTESECGDGSNDVAAGFYTFSLIHRYLRDGANGYVYWNMVLDPKGPSTWGWQQNSLVTVDRKTRKVAYNFEYYVFKHISGLVKPGAKLIDVPARNDVLAFRNPDGKLVIVFSNVGWSEREFVFEVDGKVLRTAGKSNSINSLVL